MKLAVSGSRDFTDYELFCKEVDAFIAEIKEDEPLTAIVSGGDPGADALAERYAREHNLEMITYPSEWKKYGRAAGPIKNKLIIKDGDATIAFWDQVDKGTNHAINLTRTAGKKLKIVVVP